MDSLSNNTFFITIPALLPDDINQYGDFESMVSKLSNIIDTFKTHYARMYAPPSNFKNTYEAIKEKLKCREGFGKQTIPDRKCTQILEEKILENDAYGQTDIRIFELYDKISKLDASVQSKLFYLLTVAAFGENEHESRSITQENVVKLAEHLKIDSRLHEAEAMVDLCAEKYKKQLSLAKEYLEKVKSGDKKAKRPSFFYEEKSKS